MVYDPLPGGQPASSTIRQARYRAQRSQLFIYSAAFISASLLVLIVARIGHSGADSSVAGAGGSPQQSTAKDTDQSKWNLKWLPGHSPTRPSLDHQGLPQLDWSWPSTWLSKRPSIGSPTWMQRYPGSVHGPPPRQVCCYCSLSALGLADHSSTSQSWLDRYYAAKAKGLIPDLPKAELIGGLPNYPADLPLDARLCSYRRSSCLGEEDIYKAPAAHWAVNFDDGPLPPSAALYEKLDEWNEHATHFWVGNNVKTHWQLAVQAATRGDHLAVHTWSHPHLTTYTNEQVVGELGWAMQIIYDISDHIPKYYRPPFGDNDARVRAIAKHVFNMTAIIWNHDSYDWSLNQYVSSGTHVESC